VGQAPVKFLWFPGQPHGLQKITHQLRKMKEEIKWIDKHLFQKEDERNEALKEESPLATQILLSKSRSDMGYYGTMNGGSLVPDMVELGDDTIALGRFEVTVAQYSAFKEADFDAIDANRPMLGLSKADIEAYLSWLSQKTGATYRLPNAKEVEKLHDLGRKEAKHQNNLNFWAGYELTATDVEALQAELGKIEGSLVKSVGSHAVVKVKDKVMLFDLGGNAAEYYLENGQIKTYDYSAYDFVDPFSETSSTVPANTGFRVVREK
ncbi:MAG: SUMF1/EgtB/PvdO family nonheme iron enzyme, partial [Cyclobacteriaceae bacterium]